MPSQCGMYNKHSFICPPHAAPGSMGSQHLDASRKDLGDETSPRAPSFPALEVPRSQKRGLGRNRKNSYPRYEPGSQQQQNKRQRRKTLGFDCVCFFLFVEFAPQSYHWRAASVCVCFPVGLAGKQRPKERKIIKPPNPDAGNIWIFYMCLTSQESLFLFVLLANKVNAFPWNIWEPEIYIKEKYSWLKSGLGN